CHKPPTPQLIVRSFSPILRALPLEPSAQLRETGLERHLGPVAEHRLGARDIGETIADVAGAITAPHLRLQVRAPQHHAQPLSDLADTARLAASQVEYRIARLRLLECQHTAARE